MRKQLLYIFCALLVTFSSTAQTYSPVPVTGFNVDAVAEAQPSTSTAIATGIDIQEHICYSVTYGTIYGTGTGLPDNGTIVNGTSTYQLQNYTQNNCLYILAGQTDSLTLTTPTAFTNVSLLAFATETESTNTITFEFTDGTVYTVNNVALLDWFDGTPYVIMGYDRATQPSGTPVFLTIDPRMYAINTTLPCADQQKLLRTIVVSDISPITSPPTKRTCVMAVSGTAATPVSLTFNNTNPTCANGQNGTATVNVTGGVSPTYTWSTTPVQTTDPATNLSAGPYTVSVVTGGCTYIGHDTLTNTGGSSSLMVTASTDSVCPGASSVLVASGGVIYTWSAGTATDSADVVTPGSTTTYTVQSTTSGGCAATGSVTVVVKPTPPAPTITAGGPTTFCQGGSVVLSSSAASGDLWSDNETTPSITVSSSGTFTVIDTVDGCVSPPSAPLTVTVSPPPPTPVISGSPLTFCQGDSVTLSSSVATGDLWSTGQTGPSITVYASGSYTVTDTVSGCVSPPSAPAVVTVNPIPAAPVITPGDSVSICTGTSVVLTSSASTGDLWSDNETTASITVSSAGTYTVTQTIAGCTSAPSAPVVVSIVPPVVPVITASQPAICPGSGSVTLGATTAGATSYLWNTGSVQPIISIDSPGTYQVSVTVNGCTGTDSISISSMPVLGALVLPDSSVICIGDSVSLDATTLNATSYRWSVSGDTTASIVLQSAGSYAVTVSNSCGTLTANTIVIADSCDCKVYMPNAFTPNGDGMNDKIGVLYDCPKAQYLSLRIYDRWGELVYETTDLNGQWDGTYKGSPATTGVYVYFVDFTAMAYQVEHNYHLEGSLTLIR